MLASTELGRLSCLAQGNAYLFLKVEQLLPAGISLRAHFLVLLPVLVLGRGQQLFTLRFPLGLQLSLHQRQLPREGIYEGRGHSRI